MEMPKKNEPIPKLLIDIQEKGGIGQELIKKIESMPEYFPEIEIKELGFYDSISDEYIQCGDFTNEFDSFICEHKVIHNWDKDTYTNFYKEGDFHSSLISGRLRDQCAKMRIYYEHNKSVLAEGFLINYAVAHPQQMGLAYSLMGEMTRNNIAFIECYNQDDLIEKLYWINKKSGSDPIKRYEIRDNEILQSPMRALRAVKDIGKVKADAIFNVYPRFIDIVNNWDSLHLIEGVGKKAQDSFRDFLFDKMEVERSEQEQE